MERKKVTVQTQGPVSPEDVSAAFNLMSGSQGLAGSAPGLLSDEQKQALLQKQLQLQALRKMQGGE